MIGFLDIVSIQAPILIMAGGGAVMRWRFRIDLGTLSKLNIYFFLSAFIFDKVSTSSLRWSDMGGIAAITVLQVAVLGLVVALVGWAAHVRRQTLAAVALAVMFYNSGNYGIPLAELAFKSEGGAAQSFVVLAQNVLTFTVGLAVAVWGGGGDWRKGLGTLFRLPVLPTLAVSLLAKGWHDSGHEIPMVIAKSAHYISEGLVPIALVTLGAQLASSPRWPRWRPVGVVVVLRLVIAPILMLAMLWGLHAVAASRGGVWTSMDLWKWPARLLILTSAVPTAVNTLLLTLELKGDAGLAADCVFWTTICSAVSISGWIVVANWI